MFSRNECVVFICDGCNSSCCIFCDDDDVDVVAFDCRSFYLRMKRSDAKYTSIKFVYILRQQDTAIKIAVLLSVFLCSQE